MGEKLTIRVSNQSGLYVCYRETTKLWKLLTLSRMVNLKNKNSALAKRTRHVYFHLLSYDRTRR